MRWIAVDWGSSNLRAWLMDDDDVIAEAVDKTAGANALEPGDFEPALRKVIDRWDTAPSTVMICGVAGAREGWLEAPYQQVPCKLSDRKPVKVKTTDPALNVYLMSGLSQAKPKPAVLRGEETQISGFLATHPYFDGVICLPGTHSKWVHVSAGEIVSFESALTGEIFALLAEHSILRHSVVRGDPKGSAFDAGVAVTLSQPERLATELAALRADDILNGAEKEAAHARLSGLLIGAEIAALKPYWLGQQVALIGADVLCGLYARALAAQGVPAERYAAAPMTRVGLYAALQSLGSTP